MAHDNTNNRLLAILQQLPGRRDQLVHVERIPPRPARYAEPPPALDARLAAALGRLGITRLYAHQAAALEAARAGAHLGVVTATASGKTLCYQLPALEALLAEPAARALLLFPTKALAHDQLRSLERLLAELPGIAAATFDGDTPPAQRQAIRSRVQILLSNPDMLHRTLLPNHRQWAGWLAQLRYVVLDEAHTYRGVFGTHVALIMRRLLRLCAHYGGAPQIICCSATSANPQDHLAALAGAPVSLIDDDGAPQGPRAFAFWNPPPVERAGQGGEPGGRRRSTNIETAGLFGSLVRAGVKTLTFARSRRGAELVLRYTREGLEGDSGQRMLSRLTGSAPAQAVHPSQIAAYRAGYAPDERRRLEQAFLRGELQGLVSTNALELGVDIGGVDAVVIGGFPGTVASTWQQAGRAGRAQGESLAVLVAQDDPLDQFYMRHPQQFFSRPHEHARVALDNPYILREQLRCAAAELPLHDADALWFGPTFAALRDWQLRHGELLPLDDGRAVAADERPAAQVNIRSADGEPTTLRDSQNGRTIEQISASRALFEVYPGAVYLHQGDSYLVESLEGRRADARRTQVNYYTQPISETDIAIEKLRETRQIGPAQIALGVVEVTNRVTGYRRKEHYSEAVLGEHELSLPPLSFRTLAVWWTVPEALCRQIEAAGSEVGDALHAFEHACIGLLPLFAQCDRADIGGVSTALHPGTGMATIFVYDGVPGGVGISQVGYEQAEDWWRQTDALLRDCPCAEGCPSCIQSPKCGNGNQHLSKPGARALGALLLGRALPSRGPRFALADDAATASAEGLLDDLRGRVERARDTPRGPRRAALLVALRYRLRTERSRLSDSGQQAALDAIEAAAAALE